MHTPPTQPRLAPQPLALLTLLWIALALAGCGAAAGRPASSTRPSITPTPPTLIVSWAQPTATAQPTIDPAMLDEGYDQPWRDNLLAFTLADAWGLNIYTMRADGTELTPLTSTPGRTIGPVWSPDGSRILFVSNRDDPNPTVCEQTPNGGFSRCNYELYVMNADGSNVRRLTDHPAADNHPTWSPDGSRIAFISTRDGLINIFVMNADGSDVTQLTYGQQLAQSPAWSPDGTSIAYSAFGEEAEDIYVMQADGSDPTPITGDGGGEILPAWSPDGSQIAFISNRTGFPALYVMRLDGSDARSIATLGLVVGYPPSWSPDGATVAYVSRFSGRFELAVVNLQTERTSFVTAFGTRATSPAWAPPGGRPVSHADALPTVAPGCAEPACPQP